MEESRPLHYTYGALVGVSLLGVDSIQNVLQPTLLQRKLTEFNEKCVHAEGEEEITQLSSLRTAFVKVVTILLRNQRHDLFSPQKIVKEEPSSEIVIGEDMEDRKGRGEGEGEGVLTYNELSELLGEELTMTCGCVNHVAIPLMNGMKLQPLAKMSNTKNKTTTITQQIIHDKLTPLKNKLPPVETSNPGGTKGASRIVINGVVSSLKWQEQKLAGKTHDAFLDIEEDIEVEVVEDVVDEIPAKKRKTMFGGTAGITLDKQFRGSHRSFTHKHNRLKDLASISNFLPIL